MKFFQRFFLLLNHIWNIIYSILKTTLIFLNYIQGADTDNHHWKNGLRFYRHLLNIKFKGNTRGRSKREDANFSSFRTNYNHYGKKDNNSNGSLPDMDEKDDDDTYRIFNGDGYLRNAELKVMNFKPWGCKSNTVKGKCWEEVSKYSDADK